MDKEDFLHHQLEQKEIQITNLRWIMWSSIIILSSILIQTISNIFSPNIIWISFIIGLALYFYIAFTVGQHSKWNKEIIIELFLYSFLFLIFGSSFIKNIYPYIAIYGTLLVAYFIGTKY